MFIRMLFFIFKELSYNLAGDMTGYAAGCYMVI